jgi:hypothetical protein
MMGLNAGLRRHDEPKEWLPVFSLSVGVREFMIHFVVKSLAVLPAMLCIDVGAAVLQ